MAELDEELAHSDHHIDNLEARINLLEQEKSELQTQVKDLTDVVDAASVASQLAAEQKRELIEQYTQQVNELESKLSQTTNRVEDSDSTNGSLSAENLRLEKELEKSNEIVRDLKAEILQLLEAKTNSDAMIEELRMQLSDLQQDYDSILTSEKEARQLLEAANDQVSQAELRAEKCRQECDAAKLEVIELGEQIERIKWRSKEEIDGWSEKITELEKQLEAARIESASSKETLLKQHEAQSLLAIEELRKEIHQLTEALSQSETLQNNLVAQLSGKDEQILLHEGELSKTATELTYLKGVIDSLNHDLMIEKSQRLTFEEKNIQLNTELDVTRGQIEQMQQSSQSSDKSLDLHSPQLNQSLERALQDLRDEREKYDSYRTKKDQEILELHKQLIVSQEKLENIQKQYREMAETVESERKNRTALLNESKQELQETKKQLAEALKKISNSDHGSLSRRQSRSMNRLLDDEIGDSDDDLERAMIVKHHRDLAAARAEVADLAQQLVESAHREDEMQQCITDLQQEISIIMSHMNQLQQQLQIQGQANYVRQSNAHLLSERGSSSSSSPSKITTDFSPNYELIEKYKQLYNETLERCQLLQNEIIEEKEQMNQKVYNLTSTLHDEINELQTENIELKKELYELRQVYKENLQKRRSLDMNNLTTNELIEKQKEMYQNSLERCQYLENEIIKEKELNNMKVNEMMIEYNQEIQQLQEKNQYLENFINDLQSRYDESIQEINLLKEKEKEKNKELYETQQQLKFIKNSFQDIAKPLNRLLSQEDRIIES